MEDIFKKDLSGAMVSPDEPGYDELINAIWDIIHPMKCVAISRALPDRRLTPR